MTKLGQSPAATWLKRHTTRPPTAVPGAFWQSSYFAGNQGERGPAHACPGAPAPGRLPAKAQNSTHTQSDSVSRITFGHYVTCGMTWPRRTGFPWRSMELNTGGRDEIILSLSDVEAERKPFWAATVTRTSQTPANVSQLLLCCWCCPRLESYPPRVSRRGPKEGGRRPINGIFFAYQIESWCVELRGGADRRRQNHER